MITDQLFDIGRQEWHAASHGPWVSKTDVAQYKRCPYRVSLNYREGVPYEDFLKPELRNVFFAAGIELETEIVEEAIDEDELRLAKSIEDIPRQDGLVRILRPIRNHELGITGLPDMLMVESENLSPVEVKNHSNVRHPDEIELAFYSRLLEPIQGQRRDHNRKGYVILSSGEFEEVSLCDDDFEQVDQLIDEVRRTKLEGAQPKLLQECDYCLFKEEHFPLIHGAADISLVYEVGQKRCKDLEDLGITTLSQFAEADPDKLIIDWRRSSKAAPGTSQLQKMQAHAKALLTKEPQIVGRTTVPELRKALLLDLEYFPGGQIFAAGVLLVEEGREIALHQEFADSSTDEEALMTSLMDLLKSFGTHDIVTWNGSGADIPVLSNAWSSLRLPEDGLRRVWQRHVDLYYIVRENFRLPIVNLKLSEVAAHYGFERANADVSSILIPIKYSEWLTTGNPALKNEILDHNADDLRSLLLTWRRLQRDSAIST